MEIITDNEILNENLTAVLDENDAEVLMNDYLNAAKICLETEGVDDENVEISLSFVTPEEIRNINSQFRNNDSVTDVLSFPQFEDFEELEQMHIVCLGDVIICPERAKEQAQEYGHSVRRELVYLFVHSMFHLLGYDHMNEADKKEMRAQEEHVMEKIGISR